MTTLHQRIYHQSKDNLKKLNNRNELNDKVFKKIQPQNAKLARAHGAPEVHKTFNSVLPPFCPITDTTGTTDYSVGKYLLNF